MAVAYYGSHISEHLVKTPEGYLICKDVPINRIGEQIYTARELQLEGADPDSAVKVYRNEEDVFDPVALASFEGKDVTQTHPPENLTPETQATYSKGHLENVRRVGDSTVADLMIKDPGLISEVENGILREVSCGYTCIYVPYKDGYKQTHIVGNHVAVVPKGRAGHNVAIKDAAPEAEKGLKRMKKETKEALYRFLGLAAHDAEPAELEQLTKDVSTVAEALDAEPAEQAQEAVPAEEKRTSDEVVYKEQKGVDLGSKIDRLLEMMEAMSHRDEKKMHDERDLDEMIERLSGEKEPGSAITIPVENGDCVEGPTRDAAVELLKKVRPAVAAIQDKQARAKVTDALLSAIQGRDTIADITRAAMDAAQANANKAQRNTYEQVCMEASEAYAARNPHNKKEA